MITIKAEIEISAPIQMCFDLARDIELHTKTVWPHTKERAVGGVTTGGIGLGETVTFEATHFLIRQRLTSIITEYEYPYVFTDQMQKGAFKSLTHKHKFMEQEGKTLMTDTLSFEAPIGILGAAVEKIILKEYMKRFIAYRNKQLKKVIEEKFQQYPIDISFR